MAGQVTTGAERLAALLRDAGSAVALTGAGISVPSGIPDFRSPGTGLWENVDPMEVAHIDAWRRDPERFAMLNEKSHLKAWLKFADEKDLRAQALAGARKLDHRTADAVEMLYDKYDISAPWKVLVPDFVIRLIWPNAALPNSAV